MGRRVRNRFWVEIALAPLTAGLFVLTLVWHDWIELVFVVDPDRGNGSVEWAIVAVLLGATMLFGWLARSEWQRAAALET